MRVAIAICIGLAAFFFWLALLVASTVDVAS
jgi:hypothetical protein